MGTDQKKFYYYIDGIYLFIGDWSISFGIPWFVDTLYYILRAITSQCTQLLIRWTTYWRLLSLLSKIKKAHFDWEFGSLSFNPCFMTS